MRSEAMPKYLADKENWIQVAAYAWGGFQEHGRGAVLLNEKVPGFPEGLTYIGPEIIKRISAIADDRSSDFMMDDVDEYDPERDVIFIRMSHAPIFFVYYYGSGDDDSPPPADAFEVSKRKAN
jgi:hypothetical protein